jgi:ribosomal protein S18 acetylase RimI-like enzyme
VAGCEALIDTHNLEADIERVCTHSGYRRRGFGKAVIQECMIRLQAMGMKKAHIVGYGEGAISLYSALRPFDQTEYYIYKQKKKQGRPA